MKSTIYCNDSITYNFCYCLVAKLCLALCNPMDYSPPVSLSMGFPRQEYWSGMPFPSPGDLPYTGIEPASLVLAGRFFITEPPGKPITYNNEYNFLCVLLYIRYHSKPFACIIPFISSSEP